MKNTVDSSTENLTEQPDPKERHGCLTAWLIFMIVVNAIGAIVHIVSLTLHSIPSTANISELAHLFLIAGSLAIVFFAAMLLNWKKIGFWGILIVTIAVFIYNISTGIGFFSLVGLGGIVLIYVLLHLEKGSVKGWNNLE